MRKKKNRVGEVSRILRRILSVGTRSDELREKTQRTVQAMRDKNDKIVEEMRKTFEVEAE